MIYLVLFALVTILVGYSVILKKKMQYWIVPYICNMVISERRTEDIGRPIDIMFCLADHFEPGWGKARLDIQRKAVDHWIEHYPKMASVVRDSDGYMPQHTFFYSPHEENEHLVKLVDLCKKGFGEIELHFHHDHMVPFPDNSKTLESKITNSVEQYAKYGIFGKNKVSGNRSFGFIHGDWALDNSRGGRFCGVNNELQILSKTGCYADFTFPSMCESQPKKINSIYYATDDPEMPKSYNTGKDVEVNGTTTGDLMMVQGPLGLRYKKKWGLPFAAIEAANISKSDLPTIKRVNFWIKTAARVKGKPNWIFIKVHTHGARERNYESLLGSHASTMHDYFSQLRADPDKYRVHYVTARQLYNIIKAAEKGESGNPGMYRDYLIEKPEYL